MPTSPADPAGLLSERLRRLARAVPEGAVVCDVGSAHGYLPAVLLRSGVSPRAIVTDLRPQPLARAKKTLSEEADRAEFILCDGIPREAIGKANVFVIAGMGGETIARILENAPGPIPAGTLFFLQPMTREADLRRVLYARGFQVER